MGATRTGVHRGSSTQLRVPGMSELPNAIVRPFRDYSSRMNGSGYFLFIKSNLKKPALDRLVGEGEVITDAEVAGLLKEWPFALSADHVRALAEALNLMRVTTHAKDIAVPFHLEQAHHRVSKNVTELRRDLPKLIEAYRKFGTQRAVVSVSVFEDLLSAASRTDEYLSSCLSRWGEIAAPKRRSAPWHADAIYLAWILRQAAERAGEPLSFTKEETRAVAFIDAALTRAGVKHGGLGSIARELARYQAKIARCQADLVARLDGDREERRGRQSDTSK
jgi:hypothetical protein